MDADERDPDPQTEALLRRWHGGDRAALGVLLERDLPQIRAFVRRRLGGLLRRRGETQDYVHDAMIKVLEYGPRFVTADRSRFQALLARIVENHLRDQWDWHSAQRRAPARERPLPTETVLHIDAGTRPSEAASRGEVRDWIHLAMELLEPQDREVLILRQWDELTFPAIAERLGIAEDAARMRFRRALGRLGGKVRELRGGAGV